MPEIPIFQITNDTTWEQVQKQELPPGIYCSAIDFLMVSYLISEEEIRQSFEYLINFGGSELNFTPKTQVDIYMWAIYIGFKG